MNLTPHIDDDVDDVNVGVDDEAEDTIILITITIGSSIAR